MHMLLPSPSSALGGTFGDHSSRCHKDGSNSLLWLQQSCCKCSVAGVNDLAFSRCSFLAVPWHFLASLVTTDTEELLANTDMHQHFYKMSLCTCKGRGVIVPVADHTAAQSLAVQLQILRISPAFELSPLPATQSAFAA